MLSRSSGKSSGKPCGRKPLIDTIGWSAGWLALLDFRLADHTRKEVAGLSYRLRIEDVPVSFGTRPVRALWAIVVLLPAPMCLAVKLDEGCLFRRFETASIRWGASTFEKEAYLTAHVEADTRPLPGDGAQAPGPCPATISHLTLLKLSERCLPTPS